MTNLEKLAAYKVEITPLPEGEGGGYQALYPQLARTLVGYGETPSGALEDLNSSQELLLRSVQDEGADLPIPEGLAEWQDYSGRVTLRVSKSLHFRLDRLADKEGVSLNALLCELLQSGAAALEAGAHFAAVDGRNKTLRAAG